MYFARNSKILLVRSCGWYRFWCRQSICLWISISGFEALVGSQIKSIV